MEIKFGPDITYFVWSLLSGCVFAFLYDFLRAFREIKKPSDAAVIIQDIIFAVFVCIILFAEGYYINLGKLRLYAIVSLTAGFLLYRLTVRDFFKSIIFKIAVFMKKLFLKLYKIIAVPIKLLAKIIKPH